MGKIEAIIFDWGGVLIDSPAAAIANYCADVLGVSIEDYKLANIICEDDFQTGRISEKQFWVNMTKHLGVEMPEVDSLWGEAFTAAYIPRAEMFSFASRQHKAGIKIALLSNTELPAVNFFKRQKYDMFDTLVFSCLEGIEKPDRKIYEITLEKVQTASGKALFIDDKPENTEGAQKIGLNIILFKSMEQFKKELSKFSLNIV